MQNRIVVADSLEPEVLEKLGKLGQVVSKPANLGEALKDAHVLVVRSRTRVTRELLDSGRGLKVVARAGVGLDNIDVKECEKRGIRVLNTPEANTVAVAELTIGLILSLLRKIPQATSTMREGRWLKEELLGRELYGKTLGIVGFGRVGHAVAERARAFGAKILVQDPRAKTEQFWKAVSLEECLRSSDIVTLHVALLPETRGMIGKRELSLMEPSAHLINTSRGEILDEEALYEALRTRRLAGAALDVYSSEPYSGKLLELENVVFTPHIGASTREAQLRVGDELVRKIAEAIA